MSLKVLRGDDLPETSLNRLFESNSGPARASISASMACELGIEWLDNAKFNSAACRKLVTFPPTVAYRLNDVVLSGRDYLFVGPDSAVVAECVPEYVVNMHPHVDLGSNQVVTRKVTDPALVITHWTAATYGHFLLEMLPKLAVYPALKLIRPDLKVVISGQCGSAILSVVRIFVSESDLVIYDGTKECVQLTALIMITSCVRAGALHPIVGSFVSMAQFRSLQEPSQLERKRIYVTKRKWRESRADYRVFMNEAEVEAEVGRFGFTVVVPEEIPWLQQVKMFSTASAICGEFSSALHGAVFSPRGTAVVALNYINEMHDLLAASCGHVLSYILPSDGQARRWKQDVEDKRAQAFDISLDELRERLALLDARL